MAGKVGLPHAGPFTLIFLRFSVAALILLMVAILTRAPCTRTAVAAGDQCFSSGGSVEACLLRNKAVQRGVPKVLEVVPNLLPSTRGGTCLNGLG